MTETLRPLSTGELLDRMFAMYRRHFVLFIGIAAVPQLLVLAFGLLRQFAPVEGPGGSWLTTLVAAVVSFVVTSLATGATTLAVSEIQLGKEATISGALASIQPQLGGLALTILNMSIRIAIGFLLLVIPGIMLLLRYSLTIPVTVLERRVGSDALARSAELTADDRGRIFLIWVILLVVTLVVTMLWSFPVGAIVNVMVGPAGALNPPQWAQVLIQVAAFIGQTVLSPLATITIALVYYDERVRKEGFDLEHLMNTIDGAVAQA